MPGNTDTDRLGKEPIGKLILAFAAPAIVAQTVTSLSAIISAIFIGYCIGGIAIASMAITFPVMNLIMAVAVLLGAGGATLCSIYLGRGEDDTARAVLGHVAAMSFFGGLVFGIAIQFCLKDLLILFGASENTLPEALNYMRVICALLFFQFPMMALISVLRAGGYPKKAMVIALLNVIFTVIFLTIFVWKLKWGMGGAALAGAVAHIPALLVIMQHFSSRKHTIHFTRDSFRFRPYIVKRVIQLGVPPFLMNSAGCIIAILMNQGLLRFGGDMAVAAYGIVNRILLLFIMVIMGVNLGSQPIIGYNWGAQLFKRVKGAIRATIIACVAFMTVMFTLAQLCPEILVRLFTNEKELVDLSVYALKIFTIFLPVVGLQMALSGFFMSIGEAMIGGLLGLCRQVLFIIPFVLILPRFWGLDGVFWTIPMADICSVVITVFIYARYQHNHKSCFEDGYDCPAPKF